MGPDQLNWGTRKGPNVVDREMTVYSDSICLSPRYPFSQAQCKFQALYEFQALYKFQATGPLAQLLYHRITQEPL